MSTHRKRVALLGSTMPPSKPQEVRKNPRYVPPEGDRSPIEDLLPPEVLGYIFELGTRAEEAIEDWNVEEDDGDEDYEDVDDSDDESDFVFSEGRMPGSYSLGRVRVTDGEEDDAKTDAERPRQLPFPVRMSHVCRRWRRIAVNMPVLWTSLDFSEPRPFDKSVVWLYRSKQCPLDLDINLTLPEEEEAGFAIADPEGNEGREQGASKMASIDLDHILDLIIPHVSRWRTFELSVSVYKHMYSALKRLGNCPADPGAPILQKFSLFCHEDSDDFELSHFAFEDYGKHLLPFGGHVPKLSQVGLWGVHIDWKLLLPSSERSLISLQVAPPVTTNLTDLELAYHARDVRPAYEEFINIIRCAPKLSSLKLSGSGPAPCQHGHVVQPLFLPNLRNLLFGFVDEGYASSLLRLFYAPALTSICIDFDDGTYSDFVCQLASPMRLPDPQQPLFKEPNFLPAGLTGSSEGRIIDPSKSISMLANVIEVKLSGLPCSDECPRIFYSACPRLKRLYLNMNFLPLSFFMQLIEHIVIVPTVEQTGIDMSSSSAHNSSRREILCKHMDSLTISGMPGNDLVTFVKKRKILGVPIRELYIDTSDNVSDSEEEWLRGNVGAVRFVSMSDDELDSVDDSEDEDEE